MIDSDRISATALRLVLRAEEFVELPRFKGSMLRGGFGHSFKEVGCLKRRSADPGTLACGECELRPACPYAYVFETPAPPGAPQRFADAPRPFALKIGLDDDRRALEPGETFEFGLVVIGRAITHAQLFVDAFELLGRRGLGPRRGRCRLERVAPMMVEHAARHVSPEAEPAVSTVTLRDLTGRSSTGPIRLDLDFETPLRLESRGQLARQIDFPTLAAALLRRISLLALFHCGTRLTAQDADRLIAGARLEETGRDLRWYDWERFSTRQQARMSMGGLVGSLSLQGDPGELLPYLRFGELVNVGKNCTFGLGSYRMDVSALPRG